MVETRTSQPSGNMDTHSKRRPKMWTYTNAEIINLRNLVLSGKNACPWTLHYQTLVCSAAEPMVHAATYIGP